MPEREDPNRFLSELHHLQRMREMEDPFDVFYGTLASTNLDPAGRMALAGMREINDLKEKKIEELSEKAGIDYLTKLGNARALNEKKTELERRMRGEGHRRDDIYGVLVISSDIVDLTGFNKHSQQFADEILKIVAHSLSLQFRDDEWFRRGGDEFIGLVPLTDESDVERVRAQLEENVAMIYRTFCDQSPYDGLPDEIPVLCASRVFTRNGEYSSLDEAEAAADPKVGGADARISFYS